MNILIMQLASKKAKEKNADELASAKAY